MFDFIFPISEKPSVWLTVHRFLSFMWLFYEIRFNASKLNGLKVPTATHRNVFHRISISTDGTTWSERRSFRRVFPVVLPRVSSRALRCRWLFCDTFWHAWSITRQAPRSVCPTFFLLFCSSSMLVLVELSVCISTGWQKTRNEPECECCCLFSMGKCLVLSFGCHSVQNKWKAKHTTGRCSANRQHRRKRKTGRCDTEFWDRF